MPRLVTHTATGPTEVKTKSGDSVWICRCGLTDNEDGTCNGNHRKLEVAEEDVETLYVYDENGERSEVEEDDCCCTDSDEDDEDEDDDAEDEDDDEDDLDQAKPKKKGCCGGCGGCCRDED